MDFNLSPQGDGNPGRWYLAFPVALFQLIPARGRKLVRNLLIVKLLKFQLIPARGRKLSMSERSTNLALFQLIPARGRKHDVFRDINLLHGFQLIPARGRKHSDEGFLDPVNVFQLIPARGRKHCDDGCDLLNSDISTYPRKNPLRRCAPALPKGELLQLPFTPMLSSPFGGAGTALAVTERVLPARGRKRFIARCHLDDSIISTYPRKGTETSTMSFFKISSDISTYPRKGAKTRSGL